jgi:hypothetical protein
LSWIGFSQNVIVILVAEDINSQLFREEIKQYLVDISGTFPVSADGRLIVGSTFPFSVDSHPVIHSIFPLVLFSPGFVQSLLQFSPCFLFSAGDHPMIVYIFPVSANVDEGHLSTHEW